MEDLLHRLGTAVRVRRERLGWAQDRLAHEAGLHRTYVGSVERGERNLSISNLFKIAEALTVNASELLQDVESAS